MPWYLILVICSQKSLYAVHTPWSIQIMIMLHRKIDSYAIDNTKKNGNIILLVFLQIQINRLHFEFEEDVISADILKADARFVSLLKWLGRHHIHIQLSGKNTAQGYAVYKIRNFLRRKNEIICRR